MSDKPVERDISTLIQEKYWEHLLENGHAPASIFKFCKELELSEKEFYQHYSSFDSIQSGFWKVLVSQTQEALNNDEDYQAYDSRGKLLAFFFTYFENALEYRSRFLQSFPRREKSMFCPSLKGMKEVFDHSAHDLMSEVVAEGGTMIPSKITEESYRGGWPVFLFLIEFWLNDTSEGFQDTDSLIEKTVKFGHEVTRFSAIEAGLDLGKFLFGRNR